MATFASTTKSMSLAKITIAITSVKRNGAGNPGVRPVIVRCGTNRNSRSGGLENQPRLPSGGMSVPSQTGLRQPGLYDRDLSR